MRILFVCTGNTCRSPMAAGLALDLWEELGQEPRELAVASAGVGAFPGMQASLNAVEVMADRGINISDHLSQIVLGDLMEEADLILTMTIGQLDRLREQRPDLAHKMDQLRTYVTKGESSEDVVDPFGGDLAVYDACAKELEVLVRKLIEEIIDENTISQQK